MGSGIYFGFIFLRMEKSSVGNFYFFFLVFREGFFLRCRI